MCICVRTYVCMNVCMHYVRMLVCILVYLTIYLAPFLTSQKRAKWHVCIGCYSHALTACLAHKQSFEIHRQERLLDLSEKQNDYTWQVAVHCWPSQIRGRTLQQLPPYDAQRATKYNGMLWQVDQELVEFFRSLRYKLTTTADVQDLSSRSSFQSAGAVMNRQMSLQTGVNVAEARRRTAMIRQLSVDVNPVYTQDTGAEESKAKARYVQVMTTGDL